jgi:hypothetical protein
MKNRSKMKQTTEIANPLPFILYRSLELAVFSFVIYMTL